MLMKSSPPDARQFERQPQQDLRAVRAATDDDGKELRSAVQALVRGLGLLSSDRTPCGERLSISHAHALLILLECSQRGYKPTQHDLGITVIGTISRTAARTDSLPHQQLAQISLARRGAVELTS